MDFITDSIRPFIQVLSLIQYGKRFGYKNASSLAKDVGKISWNYTNLVKIAKLTGDETILPDFETSMSDYELSMIISAYIRHGFDDLVAPHLKRLPRSSEYFFRVQIALDGRKNDFTQSIEDIKKGDQLYRSFKFEEIFSEMVEIDDFSMVEKINSEYSRNRMLTMTADFDGAKSRILDLGYVPSGLAEIVSVGLEKRKLKEAMKFINDLKKGNVDVNVYDGFIDGHNANFNQIDAESKNDFTDSKYNSRMYFSKFLAAYVANNSVDVEKIVNIRNPLEDCLFMIDELESSLIQWDLRLKASQHGIENSLHLFVVSTRFRECFPWWDVCISIVTMFEY